MVPEIADRNHQDDDLPTGNAYSKKIYVAKSGEKKHLERCNSFRLPPQKKKMCESLPRRHFRDESILS